MELDQARSLKRELGRYATELVAGRVRPAAAAGGPVGLALGLAPRRHGQFDVAVRYRLGTPAARMVARRDRPPRGDRRDAGRVRHRRG